MRISTSLGSYPLKCSEREYVLFCDESDRKGPCYSNFYGGVRVPGSLVNRLEQNLRQKIQDLGLTSEIKWAKVHRGVVDRYSEFIKFFFRQIENSGVAMRIMFTKNVNVPLGLTAEQTADEYYILYYEFIKHAFGLKAIPRHESRPRLRIYLDQIGTTKEQLAKFRGFLLGLKKIPEVEAAGGILIDESDITEVRSHSHAIMQALDVVLGSMTFRLNNKNLEKQPGARTRGKRTLAKDRLYRFILGEIRRVTGEAHFNIGVSTRPPSYPSTHWLDTYRHWLFVPRNRRHDPTRTNRKDAPPAPT